MYLIDGDALIDSLGVSDEDIYCREVIRDAPVIEVVPLDTLCKWLAHYAAPPNFKVSWTKIADNENIYPLMEQLWKEHWRSMMEGDKK